MKCECGHYEPEHGPVYIRGALIPRWNISRPKVTDPPIAEGECIWCDCSQFRQKEESDAH